jgi:hypothetical protein
MRSLFQSALAVCARALNVIGRRKSGAPEPLGDRSQAGSGGARSEVTLYVPGMS